jgi:hypothetical protein
MPKDTCAPPAPATEYSAPALDSTPALVCQSCGDAMTHDRTIPKLGVLPELLVCVCPSCKEAVVKQFKAHNP